eukprot:CAMPEP_0171462196 /NCGR_PEP_ID=MMETSP0945-20130129/6331_1 /TAXON_ID=109269 /ORGANISM="Vaucheria litorea, Strain CCMP2940" /LENGTH=498 /DNA_ID=CAMNT_0011988675 /DNA_START=134 /DNA_END=1630 /DNA_ORIENTATION=-
MSAETETKEVMKPAVKTDSKDFPMLEIDPSDTGLKVNPGAWKWPASWPYIGDYFDRESKESDADFYQRVSPSVYKNKIFENEAEESLQAHFKRFIPEGSNILEIGASAHSYIPKGLAQSRHVGIGLSKTEMDENSDLTEPPIEQDLNVNSYLDFEESAFDVVLITNSVEFFTRPKILFSEINRVLKPGGICMVTFTGKDAYKSFQDKQVKMWRDMNNAQHMWVIGSFFQFSGSSDWVELKGYDISPPSPQGFMSKFGGEKPGVYVTQARKGQEKITDPKVLIRKWVSQSPGLDSNEVEMCYLRLMADYNAAADQKGKDAVVEAAKKVPEIYCVLSGLAKGVLFPPFKALLSTRLATNGWNGSEAQILGLKEGLGMVPVDDTFWGPLGKLTMQIESEDKVLLLSEFVPLFGTEEGEGLVSAIIPSLESALKVVGEKLPSASPREVQLLSVDLILSDFVSAPSEKRGDFVQWLETVSSEDLQLWLHERCNYKEVKSHEST